MCMFEVDVFFFFSSRRRHTRFDCDWSSDVCSSDLRLPAARRGYRQPVQSHDGTLGLDRKSTRLNSSHSQISYAVFCLKKKKIPVGLLATREHVSFILCVQILGLLLRHLPNSHLDVS